MCRLQPCAESRQDGQNTQNAHLPQTSKTARQALLRKPGAILAQFVKPPGLCRPRRFALKRGRAKAKESAPRTRPPSEEPRPRSLRSRAGPSSDGLDTRQHGRSHHVRSRAGACVAQPEGKNRRAGKSASHSKSKGRRVPCRKKGGEKGGSASPCKSRDRRWAVQEKKGVAANTT